MLVITVNEDVTLQKLIDLGREGYAVVQTPHVGNMPLYCMVGLQSKWQIRLVDTNMGSKDDLFFPHQVIHNNLRYTVAEADRLTTHNTITKLSVHRKHFPIGIKVAAAHGQVIDALFPGHACQTYESWMLARAEKIIPILEHITSLNPSIWERWVEKNGRTSNRILTRGWKQLSFDGICGITKSVDDAGWTIPNPIMILLDCIFDAIETGKDSLWQLSGPSMSKYITKPHREFGPMDKLLNYWYDSVRSALPHLKLPETLTIQMVPITSLELAAPWQYQQDLDKLVQKYQEIKKAEDGYKQKLMDNKITLGEIGSAKTRLAGEYAELMHPLLPVLGRGFESKTFFSQYDLLDYPTTRDCPLYIHQLMYTATVKELAGIMTHTRRILGL